jgi:hypothetical protein
VINKINKNKIYIFFEKCQREGFFQKWFIKMLNLQVEYEKKKNNLDIESFNHTGILFFDFKEDEWKIAELSYYQGGRIIKSLKGNIPKNIAYEEICDSSKSKILSIKNLFPDALKKINSFFCLQNYSYKSCMALLNKNNAKKIHLIMISIAITLQFKKKQRYNCVDMIFIFFEENNLKIFNNKKTPLMLYHEIINKRVL